MTKLWCVTTVSESEIQEGLIFRLLQSIDSNSARVIVVLREASDASAKLVADSEAVVSVIRVGAMGASAARNQGLKELSRLCPERHDLVCFPDDDCYFWPSIIDQVIFLANSASSDFVGGQYAEVQVQEANVRKMRSWDALVRISAVCIFLRYEIVQGISGFNEALGGGPNARFSYGEDNDYAIRAWRESKSPLLADHIGVFHLESTGNPLRNPKGYLTVAAVNLWSPAAWFALCGGILMALIRDLLAGKFFEWPSTKQVSRALNPSEVRAVLNDRKRRNREASEN